MYDTEHLGVAKGYSADKNLIPNFLVLLLLLCLTGLTAACGAPSQGTGASPATSSRPTQSFDPASTGHSWSRLQRSKFSQWRHRSLSFNIADGSLPPGLVLNLNTGSITGTPSVAGAYNFTLTSRPFGERVRIESYT